MHHTPQIKKALQFAARKHHGQMRVETEPLPYITHLFSVALLVAEDGAHDDVVTAAMLHDTLEDTPTTYEELQNTFNDNVATLVQSVSETKEKNGEKIEWKERKLHYLEQIQSASDDALLISIADKIDNIESKLEAFEKEGPAVHAHWKRPPEDYLWFHNEVLKIVLARLPQHRLTTRLQEVHLKEKVVLS
jgi:(p)ppGpp synthase/HD superfamily hydrolase